MCVCPSHPTGLTHTPRSEKAEVTFNPNDVESYLPYTKALNDILAKYDEETQKDLMMYEDCGGRFFYLTFRLPFRKAMELFTAAL